MPLGHWLKIQLKKVFMGKKKKIINVLTTFFIFHKNDVKTFLKWILKQCHTALVNMTLNSVYVLQNMTLNSLIKQIKDINININIKIPIN